MTWNASHWHMLGSIAGNAAGGSGGGSDFEVTVASADVPSDLTNYPLFIDLSDMPSSFWTDLNSNGSNIRCYASDGTTQLAQDLCWIDTDKQWGALFVKVPTLSSSSDTTVIVQRQATTVGALADTDTYGRNAVWADYEAVVFWPDNTDRTGNHGTPSSSATFDTAGYHASLFHIAGGHDWGALAYRGIAMNGSGDFIIIADNDLARYTSGPPSPGSAAATNTDPIGDTGVTALTTNYDGHVEGSVLYMCINDHVAEYNASTLAYSTVHDLSAEGNTYVSLTSDGTDWYLLDATDANNLYKYNSSWAYQGTVSLSSSISNLQCITYANGKLYIATSAVGKAWYEVETDGTVNGVVSRSDYSGSIVGCSYYNNSFYELSSNGVMRRYDYSSRLAHWGHMWLDDAYFTAVTHGQSWSIGFSKTYLAFDSQDMSIAYNATGTTNGARMLYDDGSSADLIDMWDTNNGWIRPTPKIQPAQYPSGSHRCFARYDGTTDREIRVDHNGSVATDSTITAQPPSATAADLYINGVGSGGGAGDKDIANYQYVYLRLSQLTDDWVQCEHNNFNSPSTFYSIVAA